MPRFVSFPFGSGIAFGSYAIIFCAKVLPMSLWRVYSGFPRWMHLRIGKLALIYEIIRAVDQPVFENHDGVE